MEKELEIVTFAGYSESKGKFSVVDSMGNECKKRVVTFSDEDSLKEHPIIHYETLLFDNIDMATNYCVQNNHRSLIQFI